MIEARIAKAGLRMRLGQDVECVNPDDDPRFRQYWQAYHHIMGRRGVSPEAAKAAVHRSTTTIAALMVKLGDADGMLCGLHGRFDAHLENIRDVIGLREADTALATVMRSRSTSARCSLPTPTVNETPSRRAAARIALQSVAEARLFGVEPKVAFLSHYNYGSSRRDSAKGSGRATSCSASSRRRWSAMARCMAMRRCPKPRARTTSWKAACLRGEHPRLPDIDAANILYNVLKAER